MTRHRPGDLRPGAARGPLRLVHADPGHGDRGGGPRAPAPDARPGAGHRRGVVARERAWAPPSPPPGGWRAPDSPDLAAVLSTGRPPRVLTRPGRAAGGRGAGAGRHPARPWPGRRPTPARSSRRSSSATTRACPTDLVADFRTCGLTHLAAVSGTNLTLVVGFLLLVARWVGVRARGLVVVGALGVVGFVVLARPEPSVLRAAAMGSVALVGLGSRGRDHGIRALGVAVLVLLLLDPWLASSVGFALSALATAGILFLATALPGRARDLAAAVGGRGAGRAVRRPAGVHAGGGRALRPGQPRRGPGQPRGRAGRRAGHRPRAARRGARPACTRASRRWRVGWPASARRGSSWSPYAWRGCPPPPLDWSPGPGAAPAAGGALPGRRAGRRPGAAPTALDRPDVRRARGGHGAAAAQPGLAARTAGCWSPATWGRATGWC